MVNIGWLDPEYAFPQGEVSDEFLDRLWAFCRVKIIRLYTDLYSPGELKH
jgi:hypothetical protein